MSKFVKVEFKSLLLLERSRVESIVGEKQG